MGTGWTNEVISLNYNMYMVSLRIRIRNRKLPKNISFRHSLGARGVVFPREIVKVEYRCIKFILAPLSTTVAVVKLELRGVHEREPNINYLFFTKK